MLAQFLDKRGHFPEFLPMPMTWQPYFHKDFAIAPQSAGRAGKHDACPVEYLLKPFPLMWKRCLSSAEIFFLVNTKSPITVTNEAVEAIILGQRSVINPR